MFFFTYLAIVLLIRRIQKEIAFLPDIKLKWNNTLRSAIGGCIGAFIVLTIYSSDVVNSFISGLLLLGAVYYLREEEDFKRFQFLAKAHYPLIITTLLSAVTELVASKFYHKYDDSFQLANLAAFAWIFVLRGYSKKQMDELRVASIRNNELDMMVAERTAELTKQKNELQQTVKLLKETQAQLIQQEKLASLGELTAGIAHEIQNPLNFVNNFSEVSVELIDEMGEELQKGDMEEAMAIAADIKQNLEKIRHHGKRADGIVKGMLQHSRANNNIKEPTDINKLADEYLRLSYHGLRAKDKTFNAELITDFGQGLPMVNIISQDVGRVLLNLFTNAFYAVQQKQKSLGGSFRPELKLTTSVSGKNLIIKVWDNGIGIPDAVKDKILQPFFTTKPTGEGTGLGLSLSYDIIAKGHGGKLEIDSKEGEYTLFTVILPVA
ncbi:hypothetical protein GCM10023149_19130 [Mucilaginibacter gynuensis]|uniref:histidine kinase n=1 Tax=Mucilaginibacter gynuensis TaxID=1302236 RepID=A0ABP8G9P0_9SPHI